jgi:periplasmic divalent cation tolerance protein
MTDKIVVLSTCGSAKEADAIARRLVEKRLAACVNLLPGAKSIYHWKGEVEESAEVMLVIKSSRELFDELRVELEKVHSYEVPELIALPIVDGSEQYLEWIDRELAAAKAPE